jgi:ribosomal protein S18 acetylase RimI-like enzyme
MCEAFDILRYENSNYDVKDIEAFIRKLDKDFVPPLSNRVDLKAYAEKLVKEGIVLVARNSKDRSSLQGMLGFYCTPEEFDVAFISFLGVVPSARGQGLANHLLAECKNIVHLAEMDAIETRTWHTNTAGIRAYLRCGFTIVEEVADRLGSSASIRLRLSL